MKKGLLLILLSMSLISCDGGTSSDPLSIEKTSFNEESSLVEESSSYNEEVSEDVIVSYESIDEENSSDNEVSVELGWH